MQWWAGALSVRRHAEQAAAAASLHISASAIPLHLRQPSHTHLTTCRRLPPPICRGACGSAHAHCPLFVPRGHAPLHFQTEPASAGASRQHMCETRHTQLLTPRGHTAWGWGSGTTYCLALSGFVMPLCSAAPSEQCMGRCKPCEGFCEAYCSCACVRVCRCVCVWLGRGRRHVRFEAHIDRVDLKRS